MILLVAPENVVSVPDDSNCQKIRCCEYYVLGDFNGELKKGTYEAEKTSQDWYAEEKRPTDDFDWASISDRDDDDDDDDYYDEGDVQVCGESCACTPAASLEVVESAQKTGGVYGVKPSGQRYHALRGAGGKFAKKK